MLCRFCKSRTIIADGVDNANLDETYRERVCTKCGRTFYTVEFPIEVTDRLRQDWRENHKDHEKLVDYSWYSPKGIRNLLKEKKKFKSKKEGK